MPLFKYQGTEWKEQSWRRSSAIRVGKLRNHAITLRRDDPAGPPISVEDALRELDNETGVNIFMVPVATVAFPAESATTVRVAIYAPVLNEAIHRYPVNNRILLMRERIDDAGRQNAHVFVAPEYFFNISDRDPGLRSCRGMELADILQNLLFASRRWPNLLIVAGTVIWYDRTGYRNSAFPFLGGRRLSAGRGNHEDETRYDKTAVEYERGKWMAMEWTAGRWPGFDFTFMGMSCRIEICKDHGSLDGGDVDLQIVTSTQLPVPTATIHRGGYCIGSEGTGSCHILRRGGEETRLLRTEWDVRDIDVQVK